MPTELTALLRCGLVDDRHGFYVLTRQGPSVPEDAWIRAG